VVTIVARLQLTMNCAVKREKMQSVCPGKSLRCVGWIGESESVPALQGSSFGLRTPRFDWTSQLAEAMLLSGTRRQRCASGRPTTSSESLLECVVECFVVIVNSVISGDVCERNEHVYDELQRGKERENDAKLSSGSSFC